MSTPEQFPIPENEQKRLQLLEEFQIMDTLPEQQFDDIVKLASLICGTPMTLIGLIDANRQWYKSSLGLDGKEVDRNLSFCQYTIMDDDIMVVEDSLLDERFAEHPFVTNIPNVRFYAGAPLRFEGENMGTLCVIDTKPGKLSETQREALKILANEVVTNMELRKERLLMEQQKMEAQEAENLLNAFLEHSPSFISLRDKDGHYLIANKATLENINKSRDEVIGRSIYDLFDKEISDQVMTDDHEVMRSGISASKEYMVGEGESTTYFIRHMFPVADAQGEVYGIGTISNNITESKKLEHEIKLSGERFRSLFYNSPIAMTIADMVDSRFMMVNNAFLSSFGYPAEDVIGKRVNDFDFIVSQEDREALGKELMEKGKVLNREFVVRRKNGEELVTLSSLELVNVDGEMQVIYAFQDITAQKRVEAQLQQARQDAEAVALAKSSFLANMSHEIRTPLNAMLGFSDLMSKTPLTTEQREYLETINSSGKNLLGIINDILDLSKIEAGMFSIEKVPFSIQQSMHSIVTMFTEKAQSKGLKFYFSADSRLPELVTGDPTRFNQILMNLIGNALKFTNEGSVTIDCDVLNKTTTEVQLRVKVTDTGIGISKDKINSIFDRFTQAETHTARNFGGTGLGLSIVRKLVELQNGILSVESEEGRGSSFSFELTYPISTSKEYTADAVIPTQGPDFSGKKVLIVEDNLLNQKLASTLLSREGFEVTIADNGQIALDILDGRNFDVVLMDIQMPVMDGYEATVKIRKELQLNIPIIAMTANALAGERERCLELGMDEYITKPFKTEDLLNKLAKLIN